MQFTALMVIYIGCGVAQADEPAKNSEPLPVTEVTAESIKPGINKNFLDPKLDIGEWVNRFEVESREVFSARVQILKALALREGDTVADIGAGTGLFMVAMSNAVSEKGSV